VVRLKRKNKPHWRSHFEYGVRALKQELRRHPTDIVLAGITTIHGIAEQAVRSMPAENRPRLVLRASRHPDRDLSHRNPIVRALEPIRRALHRRIYRSADLIIAVAEDVAAPIRPMAEEPARVIVLDNPVIGLAFDTALEAPIDHVWACKDAAPLLVAVGRLSSQKGFDVLLDAFKRVVENRDAHLMILGEGKERCALEAQREALGLTERVKMPGHVAHAAPWLREADVVVSSSRFEGASAALVEALAAGAPMVVTDCPGNSRSLVEATRSGIVVPVEDPEALAQGILEALDRTWDREAIRAHAEPFRIKPAVDAYHRAFVRLLGA
jgi:glycosyltransferase involved in cell wall biosynthesis